jgi:toxin ParE1/3/4
MKYEFHPEALEDYQAATNWYAERGTALALQFVAAVEEAIGRVSEAPKRWRILEEDVHRCLARVFPYAILYTIEADFVLIVAIMHCSREPGYWRHRVSEP